MSMRNVRSKVLAGVLGTGMILSGVAPVYAQDAPPAAVTPATDELDAKLNGVEARLKALDDVSLDTIKLGLSPGLTTSVPTAYGIPIGSAAIGFGFQERTRFTNQQDGALGAVVGLGKNGSQTGLNVGVSTVNLLGRNRSRVGKQGSFNLKLHHRLNNNSAIALGLDNLLDWGPGNPDRSIYAVYSRSLQLKEATSKPLSQLYLNVGLGSGRFRSERNVIRDKSALGLFGSVTTNVTSNTNAFAEWSGQDLNLGLSIVPFKDIPLVVTPAVVDITKTAGDGARFTLGVAYGFGVN
jgi:hypothetical protein